MEQAAAELQTEAEEAARGIRAAAASLAALKARALKLREEKERQAFQERRQRAARRSSSPGAAGAGVQDDAAAGAGAAEEAAYRKAHPGDLGFATRYPQRGSGHAGGGRVGSGRSASSDKRGAAMPTAGNAIASQQAVRLQLQGLLKDLKVGRHAWNRAEWTVSALPAHVEGPSSRLGMRKTEPGGQRDLRCCTC